MINSAFESSVKSAHDEVLRLAMMDSQSRIDSASLSDAPDMNYIEGQRERIRIVKAEMHRRLVEKEGGEPVLSKVEHVADITVFKKQYAEIHLISAKDNHLETKFVRYDDLKEAKVINRANEKKKLSDWLETEDALTFLAAYESSPLPTSALMK